MTDQTKIKVLILDDEESIRESLADFLEDFNYDVVSAETAEDALELLQGATVDVAVVDMRLPGQDGNSFIVAANQVNPSTRFIVHTGSVNYHMSKEVRDIGVSPDFVFLKPVGNLMTFVDAIGQLLGR